MKPMYEKRRQTLLLKHGGESGLKEYYRSLQRLSSKADTSKRGFASIDKEKHIEISKKGGRVKRLRDSI